MMLRLNKRDIKRAYRETHVKPVNGCFYEKRAACAIGALALANGVVNTKYNLDKRADRAYNWAVSEFGKDRVDAFIDGFDEPYSYYENKYSNMGKTLAVELDLA